MAQVKRAPHPNPNPNHNPNPNPNPNRNPTLTLTLTLIGTRLVVRRKEVLTLTLTLIGTRLVARIEVPMMMMTIIFWKSWNAPNRNPHPKLCIKAPHGSTTYRVLYECCSLVVTLHADHDHELCASVIMSLYEPG